MLKLNWISQSFTACKCLWRADIDRLSLKWLPWKEKKLPGSLITPLLDIWISRFRRQQNMYFCLLHWCFSRCCSGCFLFNIWGIGVVTYWLNSQKVAVCSRKFESKMALKWSHPGLGYGGNDDHIHSSSKCWFTEQLNTSLLIVLRDFLHYPQLSHFNFWIKFGV